MAAVAAAAGNLTITSFSSSTRAATSSNSGKRPGPKGGVRRLRLHGGLKAQNQLMAMAVSSSTEQQFADLRARCYAPSAASKGGAATSTCGVAEEIFPIIPIMSALVLIGISIGFLLLRIEAAIEESD